MACEVGIAMLPGSSFYASEKNARHDFVRISICKKNTPTVSSDQSTEPTIIEKVAEKLAAIQ